MALTLKSNLTKGKMKTEGNKWSSVDEVLDSFNNVSIMPTIQSEDSDIFANPSPPKHRISPSQLELLKCMGYGRSPSPENPPITISRGRGRFMRTFENASPKARDATLNTYIRENPITYSNASIEDYVNNVYSSPSDDYKIKNDSISEISEESESCLDVKSPDQTSINSTLRADAEDFYPPGMTSDPVKLSECLMRLKQTRESPSRKPVKTTRSPNSWGRSKVQSVRKEPQIGFSIASDDDDDNDTTENNVDTKNINLFKTLMSSSSSSTTSLPQSNSSQVYPEQFCSGSSSNFTDKQIKPVAPQSSLNQEYKKSVLNKSDIKVLRSKRVMRNALLSSLSLGQQTEPQHLMKPTDFVHSSTTFKPSSSSAFHPIVSYNSNEDHTSLPYDFKSDPSIDPETKGLISALTSESSDLSTSISSSSDSFTSSPSFKPPKLPSFYNYTFREQDFPPLS